ncbi:unnamed protein product [Coregonus sp. 'balchen']|nr:unnamed protein product [Coregonus sp. 'balchen']
MSGPEVVKTPGGGAPGKEGKEPIANGHPGEGEQGGDDPFAEYMWMENEDVYNRQVEEELLEQEFLERCFQEMLDEEDQDWFIPARDLPSGVGQIQQQLNGLSVSDGGNAEEMARKSNLNPDAKEFVPGFLLSPTFVGEKVEVLFPISEPGALKGRDVWGAGYHLRCHPFDGSK